MKSQSLLSNYIIAIQACTSTQRNHKEELLEDMREKSDTHLERKADFFFLFSVPEYLHRTCFEDEMSSFCFSCTNFVYRYFLSVHKCGFHYAVLDRLGVQDVPGSFKQTRTVLSPESIELCKQHQQQQQNVAISMKAILKEWQTRILHRKVLETKRASSKGLFVLSNCIIIRASTILFLCNHISQCFS